MRDVLSWLFGWGQDDTLNDLRRLLANHRAHAAHREQAVIARARQIETGHYLGDRAGRRISGAEAELESRIGERLERQEGRDAGG